MNMKAGELRTPGVIHTIEGNRVDLNHLTEEQVNIRDIAWGLGRTLRYGGHIRQDHTVAHHSIVMSYYVPEEYALEALLHDAAEAYIGDIIWPVKELFPEIKHFEDELLHIIMNKFGVKHATVRFANGPECYVKSDVVDKADDAILKHECFGFGRPGVWMQDVEDAWLKAAELHEDYWFAPQYAFLQRFRELTGVEDPHILDLDELTKAWFPDEWKAKKALEEAEALRREDLLKGLAEDAANE